MSDDYIRLIPSDKQWQPKPEAAEAATSYVAQLFSGPQDDVEEVEAEFYDQVTLIDAGENTTKISCLNCGGDIAVDWFFDLIEEKGEAFGNLDFEVPCCGAVVALDSLRYDWPVGFARFEICAMNPTRAKYELDSAELAEVARLLQHPVTQILAHY
ncbi:hypothetical protein ODJ79_43035 [Actinoplanes sp. KI2]|uniref:hypothetical protein n=1 Tax=Actinoplanes sp. KI2 TaxID=2983315 RepID=UPI0021D58F85|nr:hypothetical protein [Actinoplanes sp. KI2]MCU7730532.1 hypothetical protein [Actinoplanes sp. KI2]